MIFLLFGFSRFYLIHSDQVGENNPKSGIKDLRSQRSSQTKPNFSSQGEEPRKQVIFSAIESDSEKLGLDFETFCTICFQIFFSLTKKWSESFLIKCQNNNNTLLKISIWFDFSVCLNWYHITILNDSLEENQRKKKVQIFNIDLIQVKKKKVLLFKKSQ